MNKLDRKKRIIISAVGGLLLLIPMVSELPHQAANFLIFVWPVAFVTIFSVLNLWTIKNEFFRKISLLVVFGAFVTQIFYSMVFEYFSLLKAFSYSIVGVGLVALFMLTLTYLIELNNDEDDEK